MTDNIFHRTSLLIGNDGIDILSKSKIWVFGVGGVGGYVVEALVRSGVGNIVVVDNDVVSPSNINRQIIATHSTIGRPKVDVIKERALDINPDINITAVHKAYLPENFDEFDFSDADYIVDAIDTVSSKVTLAVKAKEYGVDIISSMGTGNKLDNMSFEITDIYKTETDPLARVMRRELRKNGVENLAVVYSRAKPEVFGKDGERHPVTASVPWVPPVGGLIIAGRVIQDLLKRGN